jgi:hypothetical protein
MSGKCQTCDGGCTSARVHVVHVVMSLCGQAYSGHVCVRDVVSLCGQAYTRLAKLNREGQQILRLLFSFAISTLGSWACLAFFSFPVLGFS